MEESDSEKYSGDLISSNGRNEKNIEARKSKGTGIINQIMAKLESIVYGPFYFEVAMIFRSLHLINGILTNVEAGYDLTNTEVESLEKFDKQLIRTILECPCTTPREMLYLELGVTPIRYKKNSNNLRILI